MKNDIKNENPLKAKTSNLVGGPAAAEALECLALPLWPYKLLRPLQTI